MQNEQGYEGCGSLVARRGNFDNMSTAKSFVVINFYETFGGV
jgi:hypothetical protein